jgi:exosome complex RNA-binding protein Csl4
MWADSRNQLKAAAELVQRASRLLTECVKTDISADDTVREELTSEVLRIKLSLSIMRRDLTVITGMVNRRKHKMVRVSHN